MKGVSNCGRCIRFDRKTKICEGKFKPNIKVGGSCGILRADQVDIKWGSWGDYSPRRNILRWVR